MKLTKQIFKVLMWAVLVAAFNLISYSIGMHLYNLLF